MAGIQCVVVTPEKTELDTTADMVVVPLFDGELGILKGRSPMIGRLGYGLLKLKSNGMEKSYYVDGGFVQVTRDAVFVLTDSMMLPETIDAKQAELDFQSASTMKAPTLETMQIKERSLTQARAKLRLGSRTLGK